MTAIILVVVFSVIISLSDAAPISEDGKAKIVTERNENDGQENYEFSFITSNGIMRRETGKLVNVGEPDEHLEVEGIYSYTDPEGKRVVVYYKAGKDGYHIYHPLMMMIPVSMRTQSPHIVASMLGG